MMVFAPFPAHVPSPVNIPTAKLHGRCILLGEEEGDENTCVELDDCMCTGGGIFCYLCGLCRDILMWALSKLMFFHWTSALILYKENTILDLEDS